MKMIVWLTAISFCCMVSCSNPAEDDEHFAGYHIDEIPSWSETWDRIAYYHQDLAHDGLDSVGIYIINPDGTEKRMIYHALYVYAIDWSASGQWIYFNSDMRIMRYSYPDGHVDTLTPPGEYWDLSVSPDDQNLVFSNRSGDLMGLYMMNISSGFIRRLTNSGDGPTMPFSDSVIFLDLETHYPLSAISIADTLMDTVRVVYITTETEDIIPFTLRPKLHSPNHRIIYSAQEAGRAPSIWKLGPGANRAERFISLADMPEFSPDGNRIVFADLHNLNGKLWIINWDGTGLRQLTR